MTSQNSQPLWRPSRESLEETYQFALKLGVIPPLEDEAEYWKNCFASFKLTPPDNLDWKSLAKELRFIELEEAVHPRQSTLGNAELAKRFLAISQTLEKLEYEFSALTATTAGTLAEIELQKVGRKAPQGSIIGWAFWAKSMSNKLNETAQKPRWRDKSIRNANIALAFKLGVLFEGYFNQPAIPVSGSAVLELEDTNDWTRFFQAVSFSIYGLRATADRQAVLWAAAKLTKQGHSDTP